MMKYLTGTIISLLIALLVYQYFNPIIEVHQQLIPGDTVRVVEFKTVTDTLTRYIYKSSLDTIYSHDTIKIYATSHFSLGDDSLRTSGIVKYYNRDFSFSNITFKYPEVTKVITDTLKITNTIKTHPFITYGLGAGFGYGLINRQFDVYIGVNATLNFSHIIK